MPLTEGLSEGTIMATTLALPAVFSLATVALECAVKLHQDSPHIAPHHFFYYMGAEQSDVYTNFPWMLFLTSVSLGACAVSFAVYRVVKYR